MKRWGRVPAKVLVAMVSVIACVAVAELVLRLTNPKRAQTAPLVQICGDCPHLYQLNPKRPFVSAQGLRDREYPPFAPEGTHRILVLGDSLAYGMGVRHEEAFPKQLEARLNEGSGSFEVINSGIPGYTPYSELQYYLHTGRHFHPKVVVVSFCMNDVANPAMHWAGFSLSRTPEAVPSAAIPNHAYHTAHALPAMHQKRKELRERSQHRLGKLVQGSELYKRWHTLSAPAPASVEHHGQKIPVFLVGEDTISIEVLTDYASPEWVWLRSMYDQLARAVRADGAELVVVVSPLSYQLDPEYPFLPQALFSRYCEERGLACLDLLPLLREKKSQQPFFGQVDYGQDVWHYSPVGHKLVAEEIAAFLQRERLMGISGALPLHVPHLPPADEAHPPAAAPSPSGAAAAP